MMPEPTIIPINCQNDIVQLRNSTRLLMQQLHAPVYEQSRVSWMVDYIGRQILMFARTHAITLAGIQKDKELGLKISCEGSWLRPMGFFYSRHLLVPHLTATDVVEYVEGHEPRLTIISWIKDPVEKVTEEDDASSYARGR